MKSTVLLALALFLISAPAPDANDIAEMTQNFIVPKQLPGLEASEAARDQLNAAANTDPAGVSTPALSAEEVPAQDQSAHAAQAVQLIREKTRDRSANGG